MFLYVSNLDASKAHGHDGNSVNLTTICAVFIAHPLILIFQNSLAVAIFVNDWKKSKQCSKSLQNDKQIASNDKPVSFLSVCSNIFEKLIFNELFAFFEKRSLLSKHQCGFRPRHTYIYRTA